MTTKIEIKPVWAIHCNDGERNIGPPTNYYSTKELADQKSIGSGWYGGKAYISAHKAIWVNGVVYVLGNSGHPIDLDDTSKTTREYIKRVALDKLSPEEKAALGLED